MSGTNNLEMAMKAILPSDLQQLADNGFVVVENFISEDLRNDLRKDVCNLRSLDRFKIAKIGHDGMVQDENQPFRDIRYSETCFIGKAKEPEPKSKARQQLYAVLDAVKVELNTNDVVKQGQVTKNVPHLDPDLEELMYAYYPRGGYYRRHRDAEPQSMSNWRRYSLLLYLNENWKPEDGGQLRIHRDSGGDELPLGELPNYIDVQPQAGTLVLFRSDLCPHEVLDTSKERIAIVGWFLSEEQSATEVSSAVANRIHPDALMALRTLRDASPRLKARLAPPPPQSSTGMLGDDFCFPGMESSTTIVPAEEYPDTDFRYWKKIATFDLNGFISTLSLGGNRLRHLTHACWSQPSFLQTVTTLDLGNTDLAVADLVGILKLCSTQLRSLHLGGNSLGDSGVQELLNQVDIVANLATLDLRYNDIGPMGGGALARLLQHQQPQVEQNQCAWNTLYLEGNLLGDEGAFAFTSYGNLTDLFLGQNGIGPDGASSLAQALKEPNRIRKISLDGNQIGDDGAMAFAKVLENMDQETKTLERLFVDNNGIDKQMSIRLGSAVNSATCIGEGGIFEEN